MEDKLLNNPNPNSQMDKDQIDFNEFLRFILRNKKFISSIVILSFLISVIISIFKTKTWEGEFDIVLDLENKSLTDKLKNLTPFMLGEIDQKSSLKTQVAILESKSVLMPIFTYVKNEKIKTNPKEILDFKTWKKDYLRIGLIEETSILNISYRDKSKNLIMPVLRNISKEYQKYSGKAKRRNSFLAKDYLNGQIEIFKEKSFKSLKEVQEFASKQNLQIFNVTNNLDNKALNPENNNVGITSNPNKNLLLLSNAGIETVRVTASNQIKNIDILLKKIEENSKNKIYILDAIPMSLERTDLFMQLDELDNSIIELKTKYYDSDPYLKRLTEKRNSLFKLIEDRTIGSLKTEKIRLQAILESTKRPKGVVLRYKELMRLALRDELTLVNLENQLRMINLEEARLEDPWELISNPTLNEKHIYPRKSFYGFIGIILGSIIGTLVSFIKEKKSDLVLDQNKLEDLLKLDVIDKFNPINKKLSNFNKDIFVNEILKSSDYNTYKIINLGIIAEEESKDLVNLISNEKIKFSLQDYFESQDLKTPFLILAKLGTFTYKELRLFQNRLAKSKNEIIGIILI